MSFWIIYPCLGLFSWLCLQAQDEKVPHSERGLHGLFGQVLAWPLYLIFGTVNTVKKMW